MSKRELTNYLLEELFGVDGPLRSNPKRVLSLGERESIKADMRTKVAEEFDVEFPEDELDVESNKRLRNLI